MSRRRGSIVAVGAAVVVLLPVLALLLFLRGTGEPDVATTAPPTTVVEPVQTDASAVPFYARFPSGQIVHDAEWAVIVFYRPPDCIPPSVNLLDLFDSAVVADCGPITVDGVATWETGPDFDSAPSETMYSGLGEVPVWLVPWPLVEQFAADGDLTRRELLSLQTRVEATATTYQERSGQDALEITGSGELADGRGFSFAASGDGAAPSVSVELPGEVGAISIDDLVGVWENQFIRVEFLDGGRLSISYTRSSAYANAGPPEPPSELDNGVTGLFFGEGTYELRSGIVTLTQSTGDMCRAGDGPGVYFAQVDEAGELLLDRISDECDRAGSAPLSRVG
jgi:hypothetical protein